MSEIVTCKQCGRRFEAIEVGGTMTSKEPEPRTCPYCGDTRLILCTGRWITKPLAEATSPSQTSAPGRT